MVESLEEEGSSEELARERNIRGWK
jgi:hypothetical protein